MKKNLEKFVILFVLAAIVAFSWMTSLNATAEQQIGDGFNRAVASFAMARLLNGIISVAQGTEISIAPGGLGANLTPGQILDPVNDLVEQFSELMLIASVAFGIMKVLLSIGSYWLLSALLSCAALVWAGFRVTGRLPPLLLTKLLLVLIFVRFSVPLVAVGNDIAFKLFLADEYNSSKLAIESSKKQLSSFSPPSLVQTTLVVPPPAVPPVSVAAPHQSVAPQPVGLLDRMKGAVTGAAASLSQTVVAVPQAVENKIEQVKRAVENRIEQLNPKPYLDNLERQAELLVDHIINLIVVFVLQTIIIPLVLIWALYRSCLALIDSAERKASAGGRTAQ